MSQRDSGYQRRERDDYQTPEWVTEIVTRHISGHTHVWEPAAGSGKMVDVLRRHGMTVTATDIASGDDFLKAGSSARWCHAHFQQPSIFARPRVH